MAKLLLFIAITLISPLLLMILVFFLVPILDRFVDRLDEMIIDPMTEKGERVAEKIFKDGDTK